MAVIAASAVCFAVLAGRGAADTVLTGRTVTVGDVPYYVPPAAVATISSFGQWRGRVSDDSLSPLTVVSSTGNYSSAGLSDAFAWLLAGDDVYTQAFEETVFVQYTQSPRFGGGPRMYDQKPSGVSTVFGSTVSSGNALKPGPYFLSSSGRVYEAWKLYSDFDGAFTETTIAGATPGTYSVLPANIMGQSLAVAVPSRHYFTKTADKPLAGVRFGVKDIYDVAGLRTSDGNRAWYWFYPPAAKSAPAIQRVVDAGAVIVGKMKTSQFANGETATADWIDYHSPFNPRGDGYNDPSSSSSGPGAGIASYPWLDLTIGSDTGGSIRGPGSSQGVYGNRPSHGLVTLDGVMPLAPELDTAGFLVRDPALWADAAKALYGSNISIPDSPVFPKRVIAYGFGAANTTPPVITNFLTQLTSLVGGSLESITDLSGIWNATRPAVAGTAAIGTYFNLTYPVIISARQRALVRDPFFAAYAAKYNGRLPAVDVVPLVRWNFTQNFTADQINAEYDKRQVFEDWFGSNVLVPDSTTCSNALLVYLGSNASPNPRNRYLTFPKAPTGFSISRASPFWGGPDYVLPCKSRCSLRPYLSLTLDSGRRTSHLYHHQ